MKTLRIDPAHHYYGQRLNVWVASAVTIVAGIVFVILFRRRRPCRRSRRWPPPPPGPVFQPTPAARGHDRRQAPVEAPPARLSSSRRVAYCAWREYGARAESRLAVQGARRRAPPHGRAFSATCGHGSTPITCASTTTAWRGSGSRRCATARPPKRHARAHPGGGGRAPRPPGRRDPCARDERRLRRHDHGRRGRLSRSAPRLRGRSAVERRGDAGAGAGTRPPRGDPRPEVPSSRPQLLKLSGIGPRAELEARHGIDVRLRPARHRREPPGPLQGVGVVAERVRGRTGWGPPDRACRLPTRLHPAMPPSPVPGPEWGARRRACTRATAQVLFDRGPAARADAEPDLFVFGVPEPHFLAAS